MRIKEQFSQNAKNYYKYSKIQQQGAELLVNKLPKKIDTILDIGCGNGRVFNAINSNNIEFNKFYAVDFSENMLQLHPKGERIELNIADFNSEEFIKIYSKYKIDIAISSSALQWAKDIDKTFKYISSIATKSAFFIFTSGTFKSLHKIASVKSPIYTIDKILSAYSNNYIATDVERLNFKLEFNNTLDMLRYIKKSGVNGGGLGLNYREIKRVMQEYKLNYLEFEALLLIGDSKWK